MNNFENYISNKLNGQYFEIMHAFSDNVYVGDYYDEFFKHYYGGLSYEKGNIVKVMSDKDFRLIAKGIMDFGYPHFLTTDDPDMIFNHIKKLGVYYLDIKHLSDAELGLD